MEEKLKAEDYAKYIGHSSSHKKGEIYKITYAGMHNGIYKIMTRVLDEKFPDRGGWECEKHFTKVSPPSEYIELNDSYIGKYVSLHYNGIFYDKVLVTKERGTIYLLNNCQSNNNGHSDKSTYKYSLKFSDWQFTSTCITKVKLLPSQPVDKIKPYDFKVGDRVVCIKDYECIKIGYTGTIVIIKEDDYPTIGVEWDTYVGGHDLEGESEYGHGYYVNPEDIETTGHVAMSNVFEGCDLQTAIFDSGSGIYACGSVDLFELAPVIERRIVRIGELNDEIKIRINPVRKVRI